ncbi:MAG: amino acid adenylation domain-containing protein [Candidatus Rokubacteria bacterium]|nr:amino acid adenylation domain-containing protein [Candidatus Rokubacteria bacterium]
MPELLHEWVSRQAQRRPDAVAVVGGHETLTYARLDELSNRLARMLRHGGCARGDRVAVLMPKSPMAIIGLLGIYKAAGIYVPLDPASPASRLAKILDACDSTWLLAGGAVAGLLGELLQADRRRAPVSVGWLDPTPPGGNDARPAFALGDLRACSGEPDVCAGTRHDPAHILFTSGSTGIPKGVVITHANVIHFVEWAIAYFGMDPPDRMSGHPPLNFDLSVFDIFGTFAVGGQLHLVPPELNLAPGKLAEFIRRSELTQWFSVPSVLNYMAKFDVVKFDDFPALKRVLWCGEVLPTPSLRYWMERLPHVRFTNLYGPTEATIASSYYTVPRCPDDPQAPIPIGTACAGEELLVLDEARQPVAPGAIGELYIGGVGLSPGYWRDPEKTAAAFVPHPRRPGASERLYRTGDLARVGADGLVHFLGRADSQIKSRGYRIELGEIEAALHALPGLRECAVVGIASEGFEGTAICCAYVPAPGATVTPVTLRRELSRLLPGYMLPARWLAFARFPTNANGKIDRRRLKEAFESRAAQGGMRRPCN